MLFLLLEKYPILGWIGFGAPVLVGFIVLRSRKHFTGSETTLQVRSNRLKPGDEVQVICTEDGKFSSAYGRVQHEVKHEVPILMNGKTEIRDLGRGFWQVDIDEVTPPEE